MACKFQWIVATVNAFHATLVKVAMLSVQGMGNAWMEHHVSVILDGGEMSVRYKVVQEKAKIVAVMEIVTLLFRSVSAILDGQEMVVRYQIVPVNPIVMTKDTAMVQHE